ncbi:MerR family transcriptional regulator [Streptomonospora nanhaiensis]|uniref:DNA-binding transcriptional MerR regulator n=1 Tax=Streptomonospora nanhaiensis TaxID=1323731 RepID=A0A853BRL0_9ACTN|nr:MerR family transcriptional regulator [Streptomonospora nanhaiensis]MBV2366695.1 MerR family transcriptional regulator [Streptomonospora nanhaiensis]MBX9387636.1 MerR family transcriptional regulator [Streptomonospora nanhaiensis]NYI97131.1 DNA-binding transcriptional MerR regulator [Streptomonospora nanhaiensis]
MRIGELARRAGTTTRALRFYESQGLLSARRAPNGYREYDEADYRLVSEILALQAAGLSLNDTRPFVDCLRSGHESGDSCPDSIEVYRRKLADVDACIDRLKEVRAGLVVKLTDALERQPGMCNMTGPLPGDTPGDEEP